MIALLPMYDRPQTAAAHDAFWTLIRNELDRGPETLNRGVDEWAAWRAPSLLLAQTCGLPYRARLYGDVDLVGTPDYGLPGCPEGHFNSVLIGHKDKAGTRFASFAGTRFAYNDSMSQSGWAAPMMRMRADNMLPSALLETGSHQASAQAVASGEADFAAIDALSWAQLEQYDPDIVAHLYEIERTEPTPAPPYITALGENTAAILAAMQSALSKLDAADRATLHLEKIIPTVPSLYLAVPTPPGPTLLMDRLKRG